MSPISGKENLKREIGVWALCAGDPQHHRRYSAFFVIPAIIAENLGGAAIIAYFVCGLLIFLIALCLAEVGSNTSSSGGVYSYIETAFGPYAGFIANNIYWIGASVVADAALANALADTLTPFFPFLDRELFRILFFVFIFGGLAFLNIRSVKDGVRFVEFAALGKLIPLVVTHYCRRRFYYCKKSLLDFCSHCRSCRNRFFAADFTHLWVWKGR